MYDLKAFLFDLDGTLLDSEVIYVEAIRNALAELGCFLTAEESQQLVYGRGAQDIYLETIQRFSDVYPDPGQMGAHVRKHFQELRARKDIRIPGSILLLRQLAEEYPVAIVSGSPREDIAAGIELMGVERDLQFYLGAEDYFPGKPDPACYRLAAEKLSLSPQRCLVFEDSTAGVLAAKSAGSKCVAIRRDGAPFQDLAGADAVYRDLSEFNLDEFCQSLNS